MPTKTSKYAFKNGAIKGIVIMDILFNALKTRAIIIVPLIIFPNNLKDNAIGITISLIKLIGNIINVGSVKLFK